MKFALVIPTRGDRPQFIEQCKLLIARQTLQPTEVLWMDYKPESNRKDITQRYRRGVELATKKGYQFVVFWEDDDWYHQDYLKWLVDAWHKNKRPNFFGVGETYYYNHSIGSAHHMKHAGRTSAFCTLAKLPWKTTWPDDHNPFLDMHIHKNSSLKTINFTDKIYAVGIKHGMGLTGGGGHRPNFKFNMPNSKKWFYEVIGNDRTFYDNIAKQSPPAGQRKPNENIPVIVKNGKNKKRRVIAANTNTQQPTRRTVVRKLRKR